MKLSMSLGKCGAGYGATAGLYPGGLGSASENLGVITVGAIIAANPVGSPYMPGTTCPWAWPFEINSEFGGQKPPQAILKAAGQSTVIGAVATNAKLSQKQLKRVAIMAQDGIAMAVQPSHTPLDGDTIFAISTGDEACETPVALAEIGAAAGRCVARALMRGVYEARQ